MSDQSSSAAAGLLTPSSRAVAGLALAVAALMGQNVLTTGIQLLVMGPGGGGPTSYVIALGVAAALPAVLAMLLAWPVARDRAGGWPGHLAGAAVLVAVVALGGAAMALVGALLHGGL